MHFDFETILGRDASRANSFSGNGLVRDSEHRTDESVQIATDHPDANFLLFEEDNILMEVNNGSSSVLFSKKNAQDLGVRTETVILLGHGDGKPVLAGQTELQQDRPEKFKTIDLRSLAIEGAIPSDHLGIVAQARSILSWHSTHGFCAKCGTPTDIKDGGARRQCPSCEAQHFPRVDPVAIMVVVDLRASEPRLLLGRQPRFAEGMYSALAGFLEPGETIEDAVRREIAEEAGIQIGRVAYHSSQPWPFPSSLMIGCHAEALSYDLVIDHDELEDARWFPRSEVLQMIAGTHPDGLKVPPRMAIANRLISALA